MRIATSTIYDNQTSSIDNLSAQYQQIGAQLSSGKSLNVPSDDPSQIAQDLTLSTTIKSEDNDASNATGAQNALTFTDATLSSLTQVLQTARNLAVSGANDIIPNGGQRPLIGKQVSGLLDQALGLANAEYGGTYIFAGSGSATTPPITALGSPTNAVAFTGNEDSRTEIINGAAVTVGTTMQAAFNQSSTDGTPSVFTLLANLRDTLDKEPAATESQRSINRTGQIIQGGNAATPTTLSQIAGPPPMTTVPLTPDSNGNYALTINGTDPITGLATSVTIGGGATPITGATALSNGTDNSGAPTSVIGLINAQTSVTGVSASFNVQTQRITLISTNSGSPAFSIADAGSTVPATATTTSNMLAAFQLPGTGSVTTYLSTQIGDIDDVINKVLATRAQVGQNITNLAGTTSQLEALSTDNTVTKSGYEDTNVAQATSQFTLTQTALQAAYAVTSRLEGKTLIDYL
jgi:flagellar hook-associated protein 3 FlgL